MSRILIAIAACAALPALAESNTLKGQPGFFQPTPDGNSSLSRITPLPDPDRVAIPGATSERLFRNPTIASTTTAEPEPSAEERARVAESDMDRAEREHREMRERSAAATPVAPGAFNGATSERDR